MKSLKKISLLTTAFISALCFISCTPKNQKSSNQKEILCTIFPEYDWAREIIGELEAETNLSLLVKNGVDLHSYQPSAADIVQISNCDLLVYTGGESDAWIEEALENADNKNMKVIKLMDVLKDNLKAEELIEGMENSEQEMLEEETADIHEHHHHDEEEIEYDEHVWLSVKNAEICCEAITKELCSLVPSKASKYQQNFASYKEQLENLDLSYQTVIKNSKNNTLIFADRFPFRYMIEDYNLNYYAAFLGCAAETEASFETVVFLAEKLKELHLNSLIVIDNSDKKLARTVIATAKQPGCDILVMDSLQSTTLKASFNGKTYLNTMQDNLQILQKALN